MTSSTPSSQRRVSVAGDAFTPRFPKKALGAALGAAVAGLVLAPSPAQALTPCASVSTTLTSAGSCTIDDGGNTYEISVTSPTIFANAFQFAPSTEKMFWWGDQTKASAAALAVGAAFGVPNGIVGPWFAYMSTITESNGFRGYTAAYASPGIFTSLQLPDAEQGVWARSSLIAGGTSQVPGPLPVLGLAAAFGFSRKLRKRIKLHRGASDISASTGS